MAPIDGAGQPGRAGAAAAMLEVARKLAQAIVRDGEGATKFIAIRVEGGKTATNAASGVRHCPFAAGENGFFASDPNLGRILAAVGYAGIDDLDQTGSTCTSTMCTWPVKGGRNPAYREEDGQRVMKQSEIAVRVVLGRGNAVRHGVDLRLQPRVRDDQCRLPVMNAAFDKHLLQRTPSS
jgi:glutamate N-acetyltransferase/amino-acid N-acetyltransferase